MSRTPLIILVGADKGGVGKTTVCRALCDFMDERMLQAAAPRVLDCQFPDGDLRNFRTTAELIDMRDIEGLMQVFDAIDGITIVDVAAGELKIAMAALDQTGLLDEVRDGKLNIAVLHVLGPSVSSMNEIAAAVRVLGTTARHFVVKNHITETNFFEWDKDSGYAKSLAALSNVTIDVPHLVARAADEVQLKKCSFLTYVNNSKNSRILRGQVKAWLKETWAQFDRVGLADLIATSAQT